MEEGVSAFLMMVFGVAMFLAGFFFMLAFLTWLDFRRK